MIDWEMVAPMIMSIVLFLTIGGVLVLRPIAKHLGAYLEALTRQHLEGGPREDVSQLRDILDTMNQRLTLMEERQDFTERLLEERSRRELPRE
jgi:predicted phosphoribosyltransferase